MGPLMWDREESSWSRHECATLVGWLIVHWCGCGLATSSAIVCNTVNAYQHYSASLSFSIITTCYYTIPCKNVK